jgi:hypothetical protein
MQIIQNLLLIIDIYYWSSILNNGLFSSINYVWNKIDKRHDIYTINDGIVYKNNKIEVFQLPLNIPWF